MAGVGSDAWDRLFSGPRPAELHPFQALQGDRHRAVATPGDLLFHIRAATMDLCWELASLVVGRLAGAATVVDEVHGFKYFDERDLLGFVDGTENPTGQAAADAVTIGDGDPSFAGGTYVIVQKYLHDMAAWDALSVEEQERVIGRAKLSNVEMDDEVKPVELACGVEHHRRGGRHAAADPPREHALRVARRRTSSVPTSSATRRRPR